MMDQGIMTLYTVAIFAGCGALVLYVFYSVIWRAVRRGMREYHAEARAAQATAPLLPMTTLPSAPLRARVRGHLPVRIPNHVPSSWS